MQDECDGYWHLECQVGLLSEFMQCKILRVFLNRPHVMMACTDGTVNKLSGAQYWVKLPRSFQGTTPIGERITSGEGREENRPPVLCKSNSDLYRR